MVPSSIESDSLGITTSGTRGRLLRQRQRLVGRPRRGEQVALAEVAAQLLEDVELLVGLDALRDGLQTERVRQRDDRGGDRRVLWLAAGPRDESPLHPPDVDRGAGPGGPAGESPAR